MVDYKYEVDVVITATQNILVESLKKQNPDRVFTDLPKFTDDPEISRWRKKVILAMESGNISDISKTLVAYYQTNLLRHTLMQAHNKKVSLKKLIRTVFLALNIGSAIGRLKDEEKRSKASKFVKPPKRDTNRFTQYAKLVVFNYYLEHKTFSSFDQFVATMQKNKGDGLIDDVDTDGSVSWHRTKKKIETMASGTLRNRAESEGWNISRPRLSRSSYNCLAGIRSSSAN